jgi:hypothetical protein
LEQDVGALAIAFRDRARYRGENRGFGACRPSCVDGETLGGDRVRDGALPSHRGRVFLPFQLVKEVAERRERLSFDAQDAEIRITEDPVPGAF